MIYAQINFFNDYFWWFDPTQPDQVASQNQPWDEDHILPKNWTNHEPKSKNSTPPHVRGWVHAIGNFRVWPMELNRAKQDKEILETECLRYGLKNDLEVMNASFITAEESDILRELGESYNRKEKILDDEDWNNFINFTITRTMSIYSNWYKKLKIDELIH